MRITRTAGVAAAVLSLLILTACSGGEDASSESAAPPATTAAGAQAGDDPGFTAYRDCMAENGVELQDFRGPGGRPSGAPGPGDGTRGSGEPFPLPQGVDQETFDAAQAACVGLRPEFGSGGRGPGGMSIDESALAAFRSCLEDHDVTLPEGDTPFRDLDRSDPAVQEAFDICQPLLPSPSAPPTP